MSHGVSLDKAAAELPSGHVWNRLPLVGAALCGIGLVLCAALGRGNPEGFYAAWLVAFTFFLTIALGCLYFVLIHTAMQGGWGIVVRRFAENAAGTLPLFALLFIPVVMGLHHLYPWTAPGAAAADHLLRWKQPYLNEPFFYIRAVAYFIVWSLTALWFLRLSARQDETADPAIAARLRRFSGPLLMPVALTHTFAAIDWLMSLDPHWYSTIFGVYSFAGSLVAAFAFLSLAAVAAQGMGLMRGILNAEHFHDLGKLLFAFTVFWAYIGFSQFFLIWYGNIPEETVWYRHRLDASWLNVSLLLAVGHFAVPFFFLISRTTKRNAATLSAAAAWMLVMHLVDVYWVVVPSVHGHAAGFGLLAAAVLAVGGAFLAAFGWRLRRRPLLPVGDPRLAESLAFENM